MKPIYNKDVKLIGWLDSNNNIWNTSMKWIAFIKNNYVQSPNCNYLGYYNGCFVDVNGRPFGWIQGQQVKGMSTPLLPLTPLRPLTPLTSLRSLIPLTPLRPHTPLGGWSNKTSF